MSFELTNENNSIKIEHFFSPVIECIALLSSYMQPSQHSFAQEIHLQLQKECTEPFLSLNQKWKLNWDLMELFNFFIKYRHFNDLELFINEVNQLSNREFLYHIFSEAFDLDTIDVLIANPHLIENYREEKPWLFGIDHTHLIKLFAEITEFRFSIVESIRQIYYSSVFQDHLKEKENMIQQAIQSTSQLELELEPLAMAQRVMGKVFRRVSDYKEYLFIPSYFLTPHRIRIFDQITCMVIYGCGKPILNLLEESLKLEKRIKALSDQTRLLILRRLGQNKEYGAKLAESLDLTTATISHHLEILKQVDLIREEKVGNIKYFTLNERQFEFFLHRLKGFIDGTTHQ